MNAQTIRNIGGIAGRLLQAGFSESSFHIYVNEDTDEIAISIKDSTELGLIHQAETILGAGLGLMLTEWPSGWHVDIVPEPGVNCYTFGHYSTEHTSGDEQVDNYNRTIAASVTCLQVRLENSKAMNKAMAEFFMVGVR